MPSGSGRTLAASAAAQLGEAAEAGGGEHAVARLKPLTSGADRLHLAGHLVAHHAGSLGASG